MILHLIRLSRYLVFWSLLTIALGLTGLRGVMSGIGHYKADVAAYLSGLLHAPVSIGHLRAHIRGFNPELVVTDIVVQAQDSPQKPALAVREIRLGLDVLGLLFSQNRGSSAGVTLVGAKFSIYRKDDGSFAVSGLQADGGQPDWLWQGHKFEILQSDIVWEHPNQQPLLALQAVDMTIINQNQQYRIHLLAKLPKSDGKALTAAIVFTGNPFVANNMNGKAYIATEGFNLSTPLLNAWTKPQGITVNAGQADARVWLRWQQSQLTAVTGELASKNTVLARQDQRPFNITAMQAVFAGRLDANTRQWQLDVPRFSLHTHNTARQQSAARFTLTGIQTDTRQAQALALASGQLDLQQLAQAATFFAPPDNEKRPSPVSLIAANLQGKLENLTLFLNLKDHTAAINGDFNHISFAPFAAMPGVGNISGHLHGNGQHGVVQLAARDAQLMSPSLFRAPLAIKQLHGKLAWRQLANAWALSSQNLQVDLTGIHTLSRWQLTLDKQNAPPFLDLQTALACDDVRHLKDYFPVGVMKPADIAWLDRAFLQGRITNGRLVFVGAVGQPLASHVRDIDITKSPINATKNAVDPVLSATAVTVDKREPVGGSFFEAQMDIDQAHLDYAPNWPPIHDINGQLRFLQGRMIATINEGHSLGLTARKVTVMNPAVGLSPILWVQGVVDGEISQALSFLKNTPLRNRIGLVADAISTQGNTQVSLDLQVPLAVGVAPKVDGTATLNQASLNVLAVDLPVSRINGLLKFNENGTYSDTINATAFKKPTQINLVNHNGQTTLTASGQVALTDLEHQFNLPHAAFAKGDLPYQLAFRLPLDDKPTELLIESDLTGIGLDLPGLLTKSPNETRALKVVLGLGDKPAMPISIHYAGQLQAALQFDSHQQRLASGHIVFGAGTAEPQQPAGLKLDINRPTLNLQDAVTWVAGGSQQSGDGIAIREINLHTDNALWGQNPLGKLELMLKANGKHWLGHLNSAFAVGDLTAPTTATADSTVRLDMALLDLSLIKQALDGHSNSVSGAPASPVKPETPPSPQTLPLLALHSDKTVWKNLDLGELALSTERLPEGIAIKTLSLDGVGQSLNAAGRWTEHNHQHTTEVYGSLAMPKAGEWLAQLDLGHDLVETRAKVDFAAHWQGAPQQFSLANLQGEVDVKFTEGRILSIDPGFGRILGVLAMAQWVKRLQLDFRDLYQQGLAFNAIQGHFAIANGKAVTRDLRVDAIPARITLSGSTDFINKTLDQQASVIPKSADALPIAGTIVDEFTTLLAQTLTGDGQEGFLLGSHYQLKGAWGSVQVLPLHEQSGVVPKLWGGLTNFSWWEAGKKP